MKKVPELIWSLKEESKKIEGNTPVFIKTQQIYDDNERNHIVFQGDNLEVIKGMANDYSEKIKIIYLDPPYNTGNEFIYSGGNLEEKYSNFKQSRDAGNAKENRHFDWLNMIYPRLLLSKELLNENGVIIVSIDDNEYANLRLILDEIYGEEKYIGTFVWHRRNYDESNEGIISHQHEYIVVYGNPKFDSEKTKRISSWIYKEYEQNDTTTEAMKLDYQYTGKQDLVDILEQDIGMNYPKPVKMLKQLVNYFSEPNDVILDLFAGSGTTGQAIVELNKESNSFRKCILVQIPKKTKKGGYDDISKITIDRITRAIMKNGENESISVYQIRK
ncbi:DNA methyltransferase [Bacillus salitolerans]|uniref:DNA methyltransferase n=1 Tax=Bacillus salitolerans TaxID=1437434 RepID=A0ABW4LJL4_9BACI